MRNSNPSSSPVSIALILFLVPMVVYILDPANSSTVFPSPPPPLPPSPSSSVLLGSVKHSPEELHASLEGVPEESISLSTANSSFNLSPPPPPPPPYEADLIQTKKHAWHISAMSAVEEYSKLDKLEAGLAKARAVIREAALNGKPLSSPEPDPDYVPRGPIYRNPHAFHRSYLEMEKVFKIFVYKEGEPPLFHDGPCKSIYSMEGRFIHDMEMENQFRTRDPDQAHVHFLPFSITNLVHFLYQPKSFDLDPIKRTIVDYIDMISHRYPYWNRSLGADHFILSCHDWGPHASSALPYLYHNSIRVLCNANSSEGFNPSKDASLPEINLKTGDTVGFIGGPSPSRRPILGFFAGGVHGPIRPALLNHWKNKDEDLRVYEYLPKDISYYDMMKSSRFCICPSGYEVASPRIVEAIYSECVPVIISDNYVLPFSDVLNWKSFSVQVSVSDIPKLKSILMGISQQQYIRMHRRVKQVQRHFLVNNPPKRFDVFHMIIHSVWLRRLNVRVAHHPNG